MTLSGERCNSILSELEMEARWAELKRDVREFEFRYEVNSEKMPLLLANGEERETKDVLKWMSMFADLEQLESQFTPTDTFPLPEIEDPRPEPRTVDKGQTGIVINVRKVDPDEMDAKLRRSVERFEAIYEMDSEKMLHLLSDQRVRETSELVKWMFDYKILRRREQAPRDKEGNAVIPQASEVEVEEYRAELKRKIRDYEARYELTSEEMSDLLDKGEIEETIEIIEWKFDLRDLRVLEEEIPITGKPMTATVPSITSD